MDTITDIIDTDTIARELHVDTSTVRRWAEAGILHGTRLSRVWVFTRGDLKMFVRPRRGNPNWVKHVSA